MDKGEERVWVCYFSLGAQWNHLWSFKNDQCLNIILRDYDLIDLGDGLGIRIFSSSPGDTDGQPR